MKSIREWNIIFLNSQAPTERVCVYVEEKGVNGVFLKHEQVRHKPMGQQQSRTPSHSNR